MCNHRQIIKIKKPSAFFCSVYAGLLFLLFPCHSIQANPVRDISMDNLLHMDIKELMDVEVFIATKRKQSVSDVAPTTVVITQDDIKKYAYRDLKEVLKHTLGIEYSFPSSWVQGGQRGFGSNFSNTKLFVNGLEANLFWTGEVFNSNQFTLDNVKQVEIVFGPASTLYGADAFNGVINIVTKNGNNSSDETSFSVAKTDGHYVKASYSSIETLGDLSVSFSGTHLDDNGPNYQNFVLSPEFSEVSLSERQQITAAGKPYRDENRANNINLDLSYKLSEQEVLKTGIYWWENRDGGGQEIAHLEFNTRDELREQFHTYLEYSLNFNDQSSKLNLKYNHASEFDEITGPGTTDPTGLTLPNAPSTVLFKVLNQKLNQFDAQLDHDFSDADNYLITGLTYRDFELPNPVSIDSGVTSHTFPANFPFLDHTKTSVYIQDQQYLLDHKLQLTLGWRFDHSSIYNNVNTANAAIFWDFDNKHAIKFLYGEAFREPTLFELENNNSLKPSEMQSYETAFIYEYSNKLSGQIAYFINKASNLIVVDRTVTPSVASNTGESEIRGVESRLKWKNNSFSGYFDMSYSKNPDDNLLLNIAEFKYLFGFSYQYTNNTTLSLEGKHTSTVNTEITKTPAAITPKVVEILEVPEFTTLDFTLRKNPIRLKGTPVTLDLLFSVKNLLDKRNLYANFRGQNPYVFLDESRAYFIQLTMNY
jgi:outer membrane receptor for ferrienterochelin and colicin